MSTESEAFDHPAARLWDAHSQVAPYPDGVIPVPRPIPGVSFFPGGYGLYREVIEPSLPRWPSGGVMIIGHDFHSEDGYNASMKRGREAEGQPTWRNLLTLLATVGIEPRSCFFTNAYMGLRKGSATTGRFPGADDQAFKQRCRDFLALQVKAQSPRLILTLGKWVPSIVAPLSMELKGWDGIESFIRLDEVSPLIRDVRIGACKGITIAALTHPSLWHAAVRYRRYAGLAGRDAELRLLSDAVS